MNKKDLKVYNVNGFGGLLILLFLVVTILAIFVAFPIWAIRETWNFAVGYYFGGPTIVLFQAFLIWLAGILTLYAILRNFISINFQSVEATSNDPELREFLDEMQDKDQISEEDVKRFEDLIKTRDQNNETL